MTKQLKQRPCLARYRDDMNAVTAECILRHDHHGPHWGPTNPNPNGWQSNFQAWAKETHG